MKYIGSIVKVLPSGGYKVCVWGNADDHTMDWAGCNYRRKTVDGQPIRGFATEEEAVTWARRRFPGGEDEARQYANHAGDATHTSDHDDTEIPNWNVFST